MEVLRALFALIYGVSWLNIAAIVGGAYLLWLLYRMHTGRSKFAVDDLFLDRREKADLYKVVVAVMAGLSVYAVLRLLDSDKPIETLLLGILGIFIGGRAINAVWGPKDAEPAPPPQKVDVDVTVTEEGK